MPTRTSHDREVVPTRLLRSSAKASFDPNVILDWNAPIDPTLHGMSPQWSSLYGTPLWDELGPDRQTDLTRHEFASISGVGIWFEMILMQLVLRDVYDDDPSLPHVQFALTEIGDECRHSVMFARLATAYGCPAYGPSKGGRRLGRLFKTIGHGPAAYAAILVAEEVLDILQRDLVHDERVQPLSREVSRIHVIEEARHMRFAREELARRAPQLTAAQRRRHRAVIAIVADVIISNLVHADVYVAAGLDPLRAKESAARNEHYAEQLRSSAEQLTGFLDELGLIGGPTARLWRRAHLIR
ncbi:AurF N-oxygenase family protein [Angustibacter sp. McL0619]|uniref:AurF N-oxygenase family protein n=1 Tax=Angustibacter sp. McL0619 TaxID=3415676 RepID=UPI003CECD1DD